jgi:hypothetical protein
MEVARFFALKRLGFLHGDREGLHIRRSKGWSARNGSKPFLNCAKNSAKHCQTSANHHPRTEIPSLAWLFTAPRHPVNPAIRD